MRGTFFIRIVSRLAALAVLVWLAHWLIEWTMQETVALKDDKMPMVGVMVLLLLAYAVLIALPFVPGVELGITLLMIEGAWIAPLIWLSTLLGLTIAFMAGCALPYSRLQRALADMRLVRASELIADLQPLTREARLSFLRDRLPGWMSPLVSGHRYLLLAILINMPGNAILGGGGGILLLSGFSRLFSVGKTILTIAVAVAPVPLLVYALGGRLPLPGF
ncbi:MAG: hypothetical protein OEX14_01835 [Paracoccaceae bacterium]|nr:hypothetical protein [Paracoccaceae bacterium]